MKKVCQKAKVNRDVRSYVLFTFFCMGFEMAALLGVAVLCLVYPKDYSIQGNTVLPFLLSVTFLREGKHEPVACR